MNTKQMQGQTLIEALITLLIIAFSILSLVRLQNYLVLNNSIAAQQGEAVKLALSEIETLRDFQVLNNASGYTSYQSIASGSSTVTGTNTTFTVTWTVTPYTSPTWKKVHVTVSWSDNAGTSHSITQDTNIAGIDPEQQAAVM